MADFNQTSHNDKHYQLLFVDSPKSAYNKSKMVHGRHFEKI